MDMVSKCTKFDEDTPSRSEVKFNERRRDWKLRTAFFLPLATAARSLKPLVQRRVGCGMSHR